MKRLQAAVLIIFTLITFGSVASAHVVVKPSEVLTGSFQTFDMSVPNEKDNPTVKLKLVMPAGLQFVSPTVKDGWTITIDKSGDDESAISRSIIWEAGSIPAGFRDDFTFSAKAPDTAQQLNWKAYQTYEDGTTTSWDQKPAASEKDNDSAPTGPYSVTSVVKNAAGAPGDTSASSMTDHTARYLSIAALVISLIAFAVATRKRKN